MCAGHEIQGFALIMKAISTSKATVQPPVAGAVLFYDGECGLCNAAVRFLLRIDRKAVLLFAPLQGPTAQTYLKLKSLPTEDFDSLIFVADWSRCSELAPQFRTDAALSALAAIGGGWGSLRALRIIPRSLRDAVYRLVARSRYRLFGPYRPTPLPRSEWIQRFMP